MSLQIIYLFFLGEYLLTLPDSSPWACRVWSMIYYVYCQLLSLLSVLLPWFKKYYLCSAPLFLPLEEQTVNQLTFSDFSILISLVTVSQYISDKLCIGCKWTMTRVRKPPDLLQLEAEQGWYVIYLTQAPYFPCCTPLTSSFSHYAQVCN